MLFQPTVSVVIPTHNRAHLVARAVRSVLAQTYHDWECIVVDDASNDDTVDVVESFRDSRIRYLRHEVNQGGSAARNTGIKAALGEYIAFLDSDDEWLPHQLERQVHAFGTTDLSDVGMVYTGRVLVREGAKVSARRARLRGHLYEPLLSSNIIGTTSRAMVRRDVLLSLGGFDETLPARQDQDLWLRIAKDHQIECVSECLVKKHEDLSEGRIGKDLTARVDAHVRFYEKHEKELRRVGIAHRLPYQTGREHHILLGNRQIARRWYVKALKVKPSYLPAYGMWAFSLLPMKWDEKLVRLYKQLGRRLKQMWQPGDDPAGMETSPVRPDQKRPKSGASQSPP